VHVLRSPRTASGELFVESPDGEARPLSSGDSKVGPATAHGSNAQELIATVALLGESPEELFVVGIEPGQMNTGIGLSASVERAVGPALSRAVEVVEQILKKSAPELQGV
jgi:Ni,Fe-hydrogenase maturation factor